MLRRALLASAPALMSLLAVSACRDAPMLGQLEPVIDVKTLLADLQTLADTAAPGVLGVAVRDAQTGQTAAFNGDRRFPLQGVFTAPLAAAVLVDVDAGKLSLDQSVTIRDIDLSPPFSPIADAWPQRTDYTIAELVERAAGAGDNTAADVLMKKIGGPGILTAWLVQHRIDGFRADRYARQLKPELDGLGSFRAGWKGQPAYGLAQRAVSESARRQALAAYLSDPQDTATPVAAIGFLEALGAGRLISRASTQRLLTLLSAPQPGPLAAALPGGAHLVQANGGDPGPGANALGIYTLKDGRQFAVAVFLSDATAPPAQRQAVVAQAARIVLKAVKV